MYSDTSKDYIGASTGIEELRVYVRIKDTGQMENGQEHGSQIAKNMDNYMNLGVYRGVLAGALLHWNKLLEHVIRRWHPMEYRNHCWVFQ